MPGQTGRELVRLAPQLLNLPGIGAAFQGSIVWRDLGAFSDETLTVWNELIDNGKIWDDPKDTLLTVSTIPGHPFNAEHLDQRLRSLLIPERDEWWSIYLHGAWETEGPVDRLVDWASGVSNEDTIDGAVVDLAAIALGWMFTTSNRFLRDRATKALVGLLTGRPEAATRLLERFADVDDPYVAERIYAVAYGFSMRSHEPDEVGRLALSAYERVFAGGAPPTHLLLRDYARGVIERAIYLGADIAVDVNLIRPPYRSVWPRIPNEADIEALVTEQRRPWAGTDAAFSVDRIQRSVTSDDFAIYVIGRRESFPWLSLRLTEDAWQSPQERIQCLLPQLSEAERSAWERYENTRMRIPFVLQFWDEDGNANDPIGLEQTIQSSSDGNEPDAEYASTVNEDPDDIDSLWDPLMAELTEEHRAELLDILAARGTLEGRTGPRFDPQLVQRYIIWRVFDLGWTVDRFGEFDRNVNWHSGRKAEKPERIGKKYQWIAYHEMLAYLADRYQYCPSYTVDEKYRRYVGPWQEYIRDIDPSWLPNASKDDGPADAGNRAWWTDSEYSAWAGDLPREDWLARTEDILAVEDFLKVHDHDVDVHWVLMYGDFSWEQPHPADVDRFDIERRRLGFSVTGYFVRAGDTERLVEWLGSVEGRRHGPQSQRLTGHAFFGEYGWGPAFEYHVTTTAEDTAFPGEPEWSGRTPAAAVSYESRSSDFDCSESEGSSTLVPHHELIAGLRLTWSGKGAEFLDENGQVAAFSAVGHGSAHTVLFIREDLVKCYVAQDDVVLCWTVAGTKMAVGGEATMTYRGRLTITGFYEYRGEEPSGSINCEVDIPAADEPSDAPSRLHCR